VCLGLGWRERGAGEKGVYGYLQVRAGDVDLQKGGMTFGCKQQEQWWGLALEKPRRRCGVPQRPSACLKYPTAVTTTAGHLAFHGAVTIGRPA